MSIKRKLVITFLIIAALPMLFIGIVSFYNSRKLLKEATLSALNAIAEFKEGEVFLYLKQMKTRTVDFASDGFVRDSLERINKDTDDLSIAKRLNAHLLKNKKPLDKNLLLIDILGPDGKVAASSVPERIGIDKSREQYFIKGKKGIYIKDMHREEDNTIEIEISAPLRVRGDPSRTIGVLVNHYDASIINRMMMGQLVLDLGAKTQVRGIGKTGETYLVNHEKIMMNESLFIKDTAFKQRVDTYPVKKCLEEYKEANAIWSDYRGVSVVGASMCITVGDFKWVLVSEQDETEAFAKINTLKNISLKKTKEIGIIHSDLKVC